MRRHAAVAALSLARDLSAGRPVVVHGVDHLSWLDRPDEVGRIIREFLEEE